MTEREIKRAFLHMMWAEGQADPGWLELMDGLAVGFV